MPQSDYWALPWVLEVVGEINPASVLDLGVGMGQYGLQIRQILDIGQERLTKGEWKTRIDGVELFEPYRNPIWDYYYDHVYMGDVRDFLRTTPEKYGVVLICDVIEHFDRGEAESLLRLARSKADWVIVTTPNGDYPQGAVFGNDAETHRSVWTPNDFLALGGEVHEIRATFMGVFRGVTDATATSRIAHFPVLFENTGRSLLKCFRRWLPRMVRSRTTGNRPF